MNTDYDSLWARTGRDTTTDPGGIHGLQHWRDVQNNGRMLASRTPGAIPAVINLFSLLHDSQRVQDGHDPGHGERAAEFARSLRDKKLFELSDEHFEKLVFACQFHADGKLSEDPTVGVCWDSDRLDLLRAGVGIQPKAEFMSTAAGREMVSDCSNEANRFLTIDTVGRLRPGLVIGETGLVNDSPFLRTAVVHKICRNFPSHPEQQRIELVSEFVRQEHFPWFPCRVNVLFACLSMEQLERTATYTRRPGGMPGPVYEVFARNHAGPFDSQIIYFSRTKIDNLEIQAKMYWSGMQTNTPMLEWLLPFPLRIGRKVGYISRDGEAVID